MQPIDPTRWPIHHFDTLDSTSDEARRRVVTGRADVPFVVRADRQTKGRGRGENAWWSDEGSLTFTLAIDPITLGIAPRHEPMLALVAALAVIEALPGLGAKIRWPNDVEVDGRKLAGVLPERVETDRGPRLLIGVGINVSTRFDAAPIDVKRLATSIRAIDPSSADEPGLLVRVLAQFDRNRQLLVAEDSGLRSRWNAIDALRGSAVRVRQGDRIVIGIGKGIDADGGLILDTTDGELIVYGGQVLRD